MAAKNNNTVAYSPSQSDFKHMRYCHKTGIITLGISAIFERPNVYHLTKTNLNTSPITQEYFLKDFSKPPTPNNREEFTEKEAYVKMFQIYKEFYMRGNNIREEEIKEVIKEDIEKEEKIILEKKETKKKKEAKALRPANHEVDLFELIEMCEKEQQD
jgi:hypothetical protein